MTDQCRSAAAAIVSTAAAMAAVATSEGKPEESALWATWDRIAALAESRIRGLPDRVLWAMGWVVRAKRGARS